MSARSAWRAIGLTSVAAVSLIGVLAGCGSRLSGTSGASPATPSASPSVSVNPGGTMIPAPSVAPVSPSPAGTCHVHVVPFSAGGTAVLTLRNGSNGGTFCVRAGQRVDVYLTGAPGRMWSVIKSDSAALVSVAYGHLVLPFRVTGASFTALRQGVAHLSSARQVCSASPVHCDSLIAFRATVIITGNPAS
jgi:hypothetical protein